MANSGVRSAQVVWLGGEQIDVNSSIQLSLTDICPYSIFLHANVPGNYLRAGELERWARILKKISWRYLLLCVYNFAGRIKTWYLNSVG